MTMEKVEAAVTFRKHGRHDDDEVSLNHAAGIIVRACFISSIKDISRDFLVKRLTSQVGTTVLWGSIHNGASHKVTWISHSCNLLQDVKYVALQQMPKERYTWMGRQISNLWRLSFDHRSRQVAASPSPRRRRCSSVASQTDSLRLGN